MLIRSAPKTGLWETSTVGASVTHELAENATLQELRTMAFELPKKTRQRGL
jgi:hypothetical protein